MQIGACVVRLHPIKSLERLSIWKARKKSSASDRTLLASPTFSIWQQWRNSQKANIISFLGYIRTLITHSCREPEFYLHFRVYLRPKEREIRKEVFFFIFLCQFEPSRMNIFLCLATLRYSRFIRSETLYFIISFRRRGELLFLGDEIYFLVLIQYFTIVLIGQTSTDQVVQQWFTGLLVWKRPFQYFLPYRLSIAVYRGVKNE